jgi:hypothetical protein
MAADFPVGLDSSAEARLLAGDESSALSAWVGAAIAMVGMLVAACTIGTAAFLYKRHQNRTVTREVQKVQVKAAENGGKKPQAWPDPEIGAEQNDQCALLDKAPPPPVDHVVPDKLSASVRLELAETLRDILESEIARGLKASGLSDRLDRLEQQAKEQQVLSASNMPPPAKRTTSGDSSDLDSTVKMHQTGSVGISPDMSSTLKVEVKVPKCDAETLTVMQPRARGGRSIVDFNGVPLSGGSRPSTSDAEVLTEDFQGAEGATGPYWCRNVNLSPSSRQRRFPDPPEKGWMHVDEDRSLRMSVVTVQRNLHKRDVQTQELHRQLRQTQQDCVNQKLEASYAARKLQDLLADPSIAPQAQAAELNDLREKVTDLSGKLADSRQSEMQWGIVAKRQRAFFMQSERVAQEGVNVFRKHPAGELFLAPPPVCLEDDMEEDPRKLPWDMGNSHINPYVNDSWPFEPNACAQRCAVEPDLGRWDEEDGIVGSDSEGESPRSGDEHDRAQLMMRLPHLPPEAGPHDDDFDPPEPLESPPDGLPALGVLSARSL